MEEKYVKDPQTLLEESGLLFEINRQVLHPFGLNLVVGEGDSEDRGAFRLVDAREDAEGIVYGQEAFSAGFEQLNLFLEGFGVQKMDERREELGYAVQEYPDPYMKKSGVPLITYNPGYDADDGSMPDLISFWVPFEWAEEEVRDWFDQSLFAFLDEYVYDQTETLYDKAKREGIIIDEHPIWDTI